MAARKVCPCCHDRKPADELLPVSRGDQTKTYCSECRELIERKIVRDGLTVLKGGLG